MKIVILGPQGSGKGTQAKMIAEKYKIPHISTGDAFRAISTEDSDLGRRVRLLINHGILVPDDVTFEVVKKRLERGDCKNGFILDGYPRNLNQAKLLDGVTKIDFVIEVKVSDETGIKRISGRRTCRQCNAIFNIVSIVPKHEGICDICSGELYQRVDDKEEAIKKRLGIYHKETEPLVDYYREKGILHEINGEQPIAKIFEDIDMILSKEK